MLTDAPACLGPIQWHPGHLIGAGSHGDVFMALNQQTGEFMAVKRVPLPSPLPCAPLNLQATQRNEVTPPPAPLTR